MATAVITVMAMLIEHFRGATDDRFFGDATWKFKVSEQRNVCAVPISFFSIRKNDLDVQAFNVMKVRHSVSPWMKIK